MPSRSSKTKMRSGLIQTRIEMLPVFLFFSRVTIGQWLPHLSPFSYQCDKENTLDTWPCPMALPHGSGQCSNKNVHTILRAPGSCVTSFDFFPQSPWGSGPGRHYCAHFIQWYMEVSRGEEASLGKTGLGYNLDPGPGASGPGPFPQHPVPLLTFSSLPF